MIAPKNLEHELDDSGKRTNRWRARQFYAIPGPQGLAGKDKRKPSERTPCEWREARKR